ncbi:MAG: hypothetical protein ACI4GO_05485 [Hominenteromicrobium sp.]
MRRLIRTLFRRAQPVVVTAAGKTVSRRGVIRALGRNAQDFTTFDLLRCGRLEMPLYLYLGDAQELLGADNAQLFCGGETYTVLEAAPADGFCGRAYVRAVLERRTADDGQ